ncbi:MAG: filamentous hemagglutinin N-terminal domain-containing protein, partial [Candidatus Nanopelagicales bacterium]|nr:filamentous hemagglutinin N-terminal domain-containing protein [Candidatus Nanopelagicales bacterium]
MVLDGTVGPSWPQRGPAVTLPGPDYVIEQSMGRTVGRNLFHSFREFGLTAADVATFRGADIDRIISRVTGGNPSRIEGRLVSEPAAGFYFINPNGVVFGETASLAINGPFHVTT